MKKLSIIVLVLLLVASIFVSGCASNDKSNVTELKFGYQPSTHQIAYMTAAEKGWWKQDLASYGVKDITEKSFPTGDPEMVALKTGDIDVAYVGAAPVITAISQGVDAKIVAPVQINGSSLVLRSEYKYESPKDLKGRTIATYPPGTIQDTVLREWLKKNGLDPDKDVSIRPMTAGDAITAISANTSGKPAVDAAFLPEPSPTVIEKQGAGRTVVKSGQMDPNHACCVLVVSGKLIKEHPDIVEQIIKTHINATEYNNAHMDEAAQIFSNKTSVDLETVKTSLKEWDGAWITDPSLVEDSTVNYSKTQYDLGYISKTLTKDDIFDTSFYDKAVSGK
ncbi:sulfonate ABC transporter substrate-binding protein [Methanosarcina spelaei]|uniref:Sulfonate ABC transporter substrate-binding protein n=1 Tax=Methanosarcina spelaei TaxID=1036679 RepID=A0A2A2HYE9_9EURY|nr:ABC transporter substrate-binding protein [Methanosarcina spelaei]PAV14511.1 sulfonate ABC transporter substrate-binding protein [Methanosarcina spelaei]